MGFNDGKFLNKVNALISDTGSTALKAARLLQDKFEEKNCQRPIHLRCTLHISGSFETYTDDQLSIETRKFETHIIMLFGTRQNVKYQKHFVGKEYHHFCESKKLTKMKISSLYGSRWTIKARNAGQVFYDHFNSKSLEKFT